MRGKFSKDYWIIKFSGLFDEAYYLKQYDDVRRADIDPIEHYVLYGWKEGRNPAPWFDTKFYLENNPDVAKAGVNPFVHWIRWGRREGRKPFIEYQNISYFKDSKKINTWKRIFLISNGLLQKSIKVIKEEGLKVFIRKAVRKVRMTLVSKKNIIKHELYSYKYKNIKTKYKDVEILRISNKLLKSRCAACTIVSKNYLSYAMVLGQSFKTHNPDWDFLILLCDLLENKEDIELSLWLKANDMPIISLFELENNLNLPYLEEMLFKYNILEMNTAIKPFFLEYLINNGYEKVVYFDPDILIMKDIGEIDKLLDQYNIILTPHILENIPDDGKKPSNIDILVSGVYNLGFIAIKKSDETNRFLKWWQEKLIDGCFVDVAKGYHVDQKWIDFVPALFEGVYILKKKTYNVAYWNLHERKITYKDGKWYIEDEPIVFFHFSGFDIYDIDKISKHQNRFTLKQFPELKPLFKLYRDKLIENDYINISKKPYFFAKFPGTSIKIPDIARRMYKEILKLGNPWNIEDAEKICGYLNEEIYPPITRLWFYIYNTRQDLQKAFPNIENSIESRYKFYEWVKLSAKREYNLPDIFIEPRSINYESCLLNNSFGINLWGYFKKVIGVAESARYLLRAIQSIGVPLTLINIDSQYHEDISPKELQKIEKKLTQKNIYKINLIAANADQIPYIYEYFGYDKFKDKYNIGIWFWEIQNYFPFIKSFNFVDEIWCFSDFVCQIYRKYTNKPVIKIPFPFTPNWEYIIKPEIIRNRFGISQDDFVFIFTFDFHSSFERKNPDGVVKAFLRAFDEKYKNVKLIIKSLHSQYYPREYEILRNLISDHKNIIHIDYELSREEYISLVNASDCFISLHRSEGLGLGIMEAMYLGKCVIVTGYGGNMEFTKPDNSLIVDYKLTPIKQDFGPYKKGELWAEPNIEQCIEYMRFLYDNRDLAKSIGDKASNYIKIMSQQALEYIAKRLCEIYENIY